MAKDIQTSGGMSEIIFGAKNIITADEIIAIIDITVSSILLILIYF